MDKNSYLSPNQLKSPEVPELMNSRKLVIAHAKYSAYHTLLNTNHEFAKRMLAPQAAATAVSEIVQPVVPIESEISTTIPEETAIIYDMEEERLNRERLHRVTDAQIQVKEVYDNKISA